MEETLRNLFPRKSIFPKMVKAILSVTLLLFSLFVNSQSIKLKGTAPVYAGESIELLVYDDYISFTENQLGKTDIAPDGSFSINAEVEYTRDAVLRVQDRDYVIYLEPNGIYSVVISSPGSVGPTLKVNNEDPQELNNQIMRFNKAYNNFTKEYYPLMIRGRKRSLVDSALDAISKQHWSDKSEYLNTYVFYQIAAAKQLTLKGKKKLLEQEYVLKPPIRENHREYMGFITQYFPNHLLLLSLSPDGLYVKKGINKKPNYKGLMEALGQNKILANDTLRELILLKGLFEVYHNPNFEKDKIIMLLDIIQTQTKIAIHKDLANNIKRSLTRLSPGTRAPEFQLKDNHGNLVKLSDFMGRYVYLDFWATWCAPCLHEMKAVPKLVEKYGKEIVFLSISTDKEYETFTEFIKKKYESSPAEEHGLFLHYGNYEKVKKDYNIKSLPSYFLIGKDGKFVKSPAQRPSTGIEKDFIDLLNPKKKKPDVSSPHDRN